MSHVSNASLLRAVGGEWNALQESADTVETFKINRTNHIKQRKPGFAHLGRAVGGHRSRKDDRPLDTKLGECPSGASGRVECAKWLIHSCQSASRTNPDKQARKAQVHGEERFDFLDRKIQRCLVICQRHIHRQDKK